MSVLKLSARYAKGLFDFTQEEESTEEVVSDMKQLAKALQASRDLSAFFYTPFIDSRTKENICGKIFHSFSPMSLRFIFLVVKHRREKYLETIVRLYLEKVDEFRRVQHITLISACTLSEENISAILRSSLLVDQSKKHDVKYTIKPDILGGYIIRVGDVQEDASVKGKLGFIKKELRIK